ncbi:hypothetical protein [Streptomyces sp. NPDC090994]|uniref:hypothetical protein n=1 Tax=Streptomyces sp. NPDC090994 TaxID=3365969 RepID=UPI0038281442
MVIVVAVLLLPVLGLVLYGMDRLEDRLFGPPERLPAARHGRHRQHGHLRLIAGAAAEHRRRRADGRARHSDAA